jgi:hypothetical protein
MVRRGGARAENAPEEWRRYQILPQQSRARKLFRARIVSQLRQSLPVVGDTHSSHDNLVGKLSAVTLVGMTVTVHVRAAKIVIKRFGLDRPVLIELVLDPETGNPTDLGLAQAAIINNKARGRVHVERRLEFAQCQTSGEIDERVIDRQAHPPSKRGQPIDLGLMRPTGGARRSTSQGMLQSSPGPIRCHAVYEVAILPVVPDFDAGDGAGRASGAGAERTITAHTADACPPG